MNNSRYWLDMIVKTNSELSGNAALAEALGVTRSAISQQKRGIYAMGVKAAVTVAYMLEVHPMLVVTSTQYDSATSEPDRLFWLTSYMKWADKAPRNVKPPITALLPEQGE